MSVLADSLQLAPGNPLRRFAPVALIVGAIALAACGFIATTAPRPVAQSYLAAFLFWSGIPIGSLAVLMLQHITGGAWGAIIRRILESATSTLPLIVVLFLPILFASGLLYEWARPEVVAHDPLLQHKSIYLNLPFFTVRAVVYFAAWMTLSYFLCRWSREQDGGKLRVQRRLENTSRGGLVAFGLTMSFASIDWAMSLEPHWFSTIYGILFIGGQVLSSLAFAILAAAALSTQAEVAEVMTPDRFQDLGKLLLAFVMLWAYFSFSQFLIIWAANLPEETPWYLRRLAGGWQWTILVIIILHFALPFVLLLSRGLKRNRRSLMAVAAVVLAMRTVDLSWLVIPAFDRDGGSFVASDPLAMIGVGGVWFFFFVRQLSRHPVLPLNDEALPELDEAGA